LCCCVVSCAGLLLSCLVCLMRPRMESDSDCSDSDSEDELAAVLDRRRRAAASAKRRLKSGPQGKKRRPRSFFSWSDHLHRLSERGFKLRYRVDRETFVHLHERLKDAIETKNIAQAKRGRRVGGRVASEVRLAVTLRYLAGAMVDDLALIYHICKSETYKSIWATIDAINSHPDFKIEFPLDDADALRDLEGEFAKAHQRRYGSFSWRGQVGAIDGVDFAMKTPGKSVQNPNRWFFVQRKGHYCLLCIAICDSHRRFTHFDVSFASGSHDSLAWIGSKLGKRVHDGGLRHPYFLNGDNAFTCANHTIVPMNDTDFDFYQSSNRLVYLLMFLVALFAAYSTESMPGYAWGFIFTWRGMITTTPVLSFRRMAIECAFGILVRRWGVFWRPLEVRMDRRAPLISAAMRMHNYCIDRRISIDLRQVAGASEIQPRVWAPTPNFGKNGEPLDFLDTTNPPAPSVSVCSRRNDLKQGLAAAALKRPRESARSEALRARR